MFYQLGEEVISHRSLLIITKKFTKTLLNLDNKILLFLMIKKKISDKQVKDFLERNPNFFVENQAILKKINFPLNQKNLDQKNPNIIPFKDWVIENLKKKQRDIIETAKHNFFTQKKIHGSIINLLKKKKIDEFLIYLTNDLPKHFELEVISIVTSNLNIPKKFNLRFEQSNLINAIYGKENQLIMDAVDKDLGIFKESKEKIYSNAIYSLKKEIFDKPSLLIFGSKDKHFIDNRAYDLILFFSNVVQERLNQFLYE